MAYVLSWLHWLPLISRLPDSLLVLVGGVICAGVAIGAMALIVLAAVWMERKVSAHMQCRLGPMYVGWHGVLQTAADGIKLFIKEDIIPAMVDKWLYITAPALVITGAIMAWLVIPLTPWYVAADLNIGVLYLLSTSTLVTIGIIMAGWSSHNKWSLYGTMRSAAQFLSYEIPTALFVLPPVLLAGSLNLGTIVRQQAGGISQWYVWNPFCLIAFIFYYVSSLAETNRTPFDLPESESELVAGFHTEYSGMRFAFFFLAEYADIVVVSAFASLLFLGGWYGPFGWSHPLFYFLKVLALVFVTMWLRWTLPRLRIDQLMSTCWKFLIPLGLLDILGVSFWMWVIS